MLDGFIALFISSIIFLLIFQLPYIATHNPRDIFLILIDVLIFAYIVIGYNYTFFILQFMDHVVISLMFILCILHIVSISLKYIDEYPIKISK